MLQHIDLALPPGKKVAVVGPSGAGKTTLINLVLRYWPVSFGEIRLNDKLLTAYSGDDLRKHVSVISQNTYLFNATIRENLLLAQPAASEDQMRQHLNWLRWIPSFRSYQMLWTPGLVSMGANSVPDNGSAWRWLALSYGMILSCCWMSQL